MIAAKVMDEARNHLINNRGWHGQRFGPATRREEGAAPKWGCNRRTAKWQAQRSAVSSRPCFVSSFSCFLFSFFHAAAGIYEMTSNNAKFKFSSLITLAAALVVFEGCGGMAPHERQTGRLLDDKVTVGRVQSVLTNNVS